MNRQKIKIIETPILGELIVNTRRKQRSCFWWLIASVAGMMILVYFSSDPVTIIFRCLFAVPWCVGMTTMIYTLIFHFRERRLRKELLRRADEVPMSLRRGAYQLYGYGIDGNMAAIECNECHLPGDCPLCGAE